MSDLGEAAELMSDTIEELKEENKELRAENLRLSTENEGLKASLRNLGFHADVWKPIETAVKNGDIIWLGRPCEQRLARWKTPDWIDIALEVEPIWFAPTHWRPILDPESTEMPAQRTDLSTIIRGKPTSFYPGNMSFLIREAENLQGINHRYDRTGTPWPIRETNDSQKLFSMTYIRLKPDVHPLTYHFFFGKWNKKEAKKKSGAPKGTILDNPEAAARCWDLGCHQIVWLSSKKRASKLDLPILVHEITHASLHAGAEIGFTDRDAGAEFYAYMNQWLIKKVIKALRKPNVDRIS